MRLALFQPDIPQNAGAMLRLAACLGVAVDLIEPAGFPLDDKRLRRSGMDYLEAVDLTRHDSWDAFRKRRPSAEPESTLGPHAGRLVLLTTKARLSHLDFVFRADDTILVGRESAGVPAEVHDAADARLRIPMAPGARSLNVALAAAMVLGEALRQTGMFRTLA